MIVLAAIQTLLVGWQLWHVVKLRRSIRRLDALSDELEELLALEDACSEEEA